jgi:hypothetical protein
MRDAELVNDPSRISGGNGEFRNGFNHNGARANDAAPGRSLEPDGPSLRRIAAMKPRLCAVECGAGRVAIGSTFEDMRA